MNSVCGRHYLAEMHNEVKEETAEVRKRVCTFPSSACGGIVMALSQARSPRVLSRSHRLSPMNMKQKHLMHLNTIFNKSDDSLFPRSPKYWNRVNTLSSPSANYRNGRYCRDHTSCTVDSDYSLHRFQKQSTLKYKEQIECCSSPDLSVNTPDRNALSKVISKKEIKYCLGNGAFGTVLRASYKGERVAVKMVLKLKVSSLLYEANALHLNHENIIKIFKIIVEKEYGLVFMERNFGPNLHECLHQLCMPLNASDRIRYMLNIAHALEYCHSSRILHLDVKPKNILLSTSKNICKLCDFGCSVCIDDLDKHLQKINFGVNTVCYTDPQLLCGKLPSPKSDVYSFGITMWQVISLEIPYEGIDCHTLIYKVVSGNCRPKEINAKSEHDKRYINLYQLCWRTQPSSRPEMLYIVEEMKNILREEQLNRNDKEF